MNTSSEKIRAFLGIETAILGGSISLSVNGRAFTPSFSVSRSETILASIQRSLVDANIELSQVDCIAVSIGPGSFTGIRTGIATALGLKTAKSIDCVGISTLEAVASSRKSRNRNAVVPIGRGQFAVQYFAANKSAATHDSAIVVTDAAELLEMIRSENETQFVFARESSTDKVDIFEAFKSGANVELCADSTAELICVIAANGEGVRELIPIYARRQS